MKRLSRAARVFYATPVIQQKCARAIETYFTSELFKNLDYSPGRVSWITRMQPTRGIVVADLTCSAYAKMLGVVPA